MPYSSTAEIYFIAAMMFLILAVCTVACYFFFKTFQREKRAKQAARLQKQREKQAVELSKSE